MTRPDLFFHNWFIPPSAPATELCLKDVHHNAGRAATTSVDRVPLLRAMRPNRICFGWGSKMGRALNMTDIPIAF